MRMRVRWRGWLLALAIFAFGVACGVGGSVMAALYLVRGSFHASASRPGLVDRVVDRLSSDVRDDLELDEATMARVDAELRAFATDVKTIRIEATGRVVADAHVALARIEQSLPEEKRSAFRTLAERRLRLLGMPLQAPETKEGSP